MVVMVDSSWLCVVLCKALVRRGPVAAKEEVCRLAGDAYVDFRLANDDFDGELYSFVKVDKRLLSLESFRKSQRILGVLSSYDSPTFLSDSEVQGFVVDEEVEHTCFRYGDMVSVSGDNPFSGLKGVVELPGYDESQVIFRFHAETKRAWLDNTELEVYGNVFDVVKFPTTREIDLTDEKFPAREEDCVNIWERNRR
jgi:hypothetical protein